MKTTFNTLLLIFLVSFTLQAQTYSITTKLDSLFLEWEKPNHPGGAVAVMQDGKLIFSNAYGLASMEYGIPNTPNTIFNIGSVSKQFTALGIVLLDLEGKLSVDDEVRKHLPEIPDFGKPITIRHLLHHTSGMRSLHDMLGLAGWRSDDSRTNADLLRFMTKQKELNFDPGEEHLYCNTGYMLMADIIERVTGEKFTDWSKNNIFGPLGMKDSYVEDDYSRIVANNATSYNLNKSGFNRAVEYWGYVGSGNMHSTTADLVTYLCNYHHPKEGWQDAFKRMPTLGVLNNGDTLDYAFGVKLDNYQNESRVQHGGSIGGFRAFIASYPERELDIVVLTNFSNAAPNTKADQILDIILNKPAAEKVWSVSSPSMKDKNFTTDNPGQYVGNYYSEELESTYKIFMNGEKLKGYHSRHGEFDIEIEDQDQLSGDLRIFKNIKVKRNAQQEIEGIYVSNGRVRNLWFEKVGQ